MDKPFSAAVEANWLGSLAATLSGPAFLLGGFLLGSLLLGGSLCLAFLSTKDTVPVIGEFFAGAGTNNRA